MHYFFVFSSIVNWIFILALSFYLLTNLQWYNYSLYRIITKHHKQYWHLYFFVLPLLVFFGAHISGSKIIFLIASALFFFVYLPFLIIWHLHLDKKLQFTRRIISFFIILIGFLSLHQLLFYFIKNHNILSSLFILPLLFALITSFIYEKILFDRYRSLAKLKINSFSHLKIIAITGSFGKTSIKNFLFQILANQYQVYATPRSINTIKGIVSDINTHLSKDIEIYIAEAGARQKGDIQEIAHLLNHQYAIIGEIGEQHIEYFKTTQNVSQAKFELLESKRLKKALVYQDNQIPPYLTKEQQGVLTTYPKNLKNIISTLDETTFELEIQGVYYPFQTNVLGTFNIANLSASILMAHELNLPIPTIQKAIKNLECVQHRLQKYSANGKIILDDSFNGNLKGMLEAIRLSSLYEGRKVIITPGLVESNHQSNATLAKAINQVFDLVIITGELNSKVLSDHISRPQKIVLKDKSQLQNILLTSTYKGDLLLFANDAPNFI